MDLDKQLSIIQDQENINEVEPLTSVVAGGLVIGSVYIIANFVSFLLAATSMRISNPVSRDLTGRITKILNDRKWVVHAVKDDNPNAFAIGGKHIFVTTGLRKFMTEREVDAIMIHEVYHNKRKHIYKRMAYEYPLFYLIVTMSFAAMILVTPIIGFLAFLIMRKITQIAYNVSFGRKHEREADAYAAKLGYGPEMRSALEKLEKEYLKMLRSPKCDAICRIINKLDQVIDEHPPIRERIENLLEKEKELARVLKTRSFKKIKDFVVQEFRKDAR